MIEVNIIIPVHNAALTLRDTLDSALHQRRSESHEIIVYVCCYDDASTDASKEILSEFQQKSKSGDKSIIETHLLVASSPDGVSRGAGYARNRAVELRRNAAPSTCFLCMLDSDDIMKPNRVTEQVNYMITAFATEDGRNSALLGSQFTRDPPDASWHYASWANQLSDERLYLERFREVTLIQPTWMISRQRFESLGGYVEAPHPDKLDEVGTVIHAWQGVAPIFRNDSSSSTAPLRLIHPKVDTHKTLRLAEDLRFFYAHLERQGTLHLLRRELVVYKQVQGSSQSSQTSRKLLLQLRTSAFEQLILCKCTEWRNKQFVVWGAGRDGKDFVKMLSDNIRHRVYCFVDVDDKKIEQGYYVNRDIGAKIPIVHFSWLINDPCRRERIQQRWMEGHDTADDGYGRIDKSKPEEGLKNGAEDVVAPPPIKKQRKRSLHALKGDEIDFSLLPDLPVVVCVALYRTNGALERNVASINRTEGKNLWHLV
ncbi:hypothetical protein MPSEU_000490400 [Mayamaea pseudoterrestris]|nr:hypothetical protein MPSEU_000490400 [Mayamaea pseudoterrestris]